MLVATLLAFVATATVSAQAIDDPNIVVPFSSPEPQEGTRIEQVEAGPLPQGPVALKHALAKYGATPPSAVVQAAAAATQSGSVTASNLPFDKAYLSPVKILSQPKATFQLDFDTGSSDLWVFSQGLPQSQRGTGHTLYNNGGTIQNQDGESWDISYQDGSGSSGKVYADKVAIGKVTATVQAVEAATSVAASFTSGESDGLVGLGFDAGNTCNPYQCFTFMHQVGPTLPLNLFTATLRKGAPGTYDFGFIDQAKYKGTIAYAKINHSTSGNPAYWEFISTGHSFGTGKKVAKSFAAIADTGTSLLMLDQATVNAYYSNIPQAYYDQNYGAILFPCDAPLRTFSLYIGNQKRTMPASYAIYGRVSSPDGYCFGGIQSAGNLGFAIIGDVFLKSQFVVFDRSVPRVGFAQQA